MFRIMPMSMEENENKGKGGTNYAIESGRGLLRSY